MQPTAFYRASTTCNGSRSDSRPFHSNPTVGRSAQIAVFVLVASANAISFAADCNDNGIDDISDIEAGVSLDCNADGIPDECQVVDPELHLITEIRVPTGHEPVAIVSADFDRDGEPDLATVNKSSHDVTVLLRGADSPFSLIDTVPLGGEGLSLATADLDGDGIPDLVAGALSEDSPPGLCHILIGRGDGTFEPRDGNHLQHMSFSVAVADLDGDGHVDIATNGIDDQHNAGLTTWLGAGDGSFTIRSTQHITDSIGKLELGDFDGDRVLDAVVRRPRVDSVTVLFGRGDGSFRLGGSVSSLWAKMTVADVNDDGRDDLVAADKTRFAVNIAAEDGSFPQWDSIPMALSPSELIVRDMNGDGALDVIIISHHDHVALLFGLGAGRFSEPLHYTAGARPSAGVTLDLDGDHALDLAVATRRGEIVLIPDIGSDQAAAPRVLLKGVQNEAVHTIALSDIDGDGVRDLITLRESPGVGLSIGHGLGDGTYSYGPLTPLDEFWPVWMFPADWDGDGDIEILAGSSDGYRFRLIELGGDGTANPGGIFELSYGEHPGNKVVVFASFVDEDELLDLVVVGSKIFVFTGQGSAEFVLGPVIHPERESRAALLEDVDGDGQVDLISVDNRSGLVSVRRGTDDGEFLPPLSYRSVPEENDDVQPLAVKGADVNGDGHLDLVIVNLQQRALLILLGDGCGAFERIESVPIDHPSPELEFADLDLDGNLDVMVGTNDRRHVLVLTGKGDGTFELGTRLAMGTTAPRFIPEDVDRDGRPDLLVVTENDDLHVGILALVRNDSLRIVPDCDESGIPDSCEIETGAVPDENDNGVPDSCDPDCNENGTPDDIEISTGALADCDQSGIPDVCEIADGTHLDVDGDGIPDSCQEDCDHNSVPDAFEIETGATGDCDESGVPDSCEIADGIHLDVDGDGVPDSCQTDCNGNTIPDALELTSGSAQDCDEDGGLDECQIAGDLRLDIDANGVLDACEPDCDENRIPDPFEIAQGTKDDCNGNGVLDICEIASGALRDCDGSGAADICELTEGILLDRDGDGVPDSCVGGFQKPGDCNQDGSTNLADAVCVLGVLFGGQPTEFPCDNGSRDSAANQSLLDWQGDDSLNLADAVALLVYLFGDGVPHVLSSSVDPVTGCVWIAACPETTCTAD